MNLNQAAVEKVIRKVVARYTRKVWWARKPDVVDDLVQQGWLIVLESVPRWDPNVGIPFLAYCERAMTLGLPEVLWGLSSPASASKHDREKGKLAGAHHANASGGDDVVGSHSNERPDQTPSSAFNRYQLENQGTWADALIADKEWHARARRALAAIVSEGDPDVRRGVRYELEKADDGPSSSEIAIRDDVRVGKVYKSSYLAKQRLRCDRELWELTKERGK